MSSEKTDLCKGNHYHCSSDQCSCGCHENRCETCRGYGEVGGLTPYGYDGNICDDCNGTGFAENLPVYK